jgi:hypothetical protein
MKVKKIKNNLYNSLGLAFCLTLTACSGELLSTGKVGKTAPLQAPGGWIESQKVSSDNSVTLRKSELNPAGKDVMRAQLRQTDLVQIPVDPSYNVTLFKIRNVKEYEHTAFVAPRVYAYGAAEKARISPESHSDGTVTIPFHLAMVSGTESSIESTRGHDRVDLPDSVLVKNIEKLRTDLFGRFEGFNTLSVLPGCPKKIMIVVNGEEFEATNTDLANGDYCSPNTPFTAAIRVSKERAQYLLQDAIYNGQVEARASYETTVAFSVAKLQIEFQKQKIFEELEAQFHGVIYWVTAEAYDKVTNIVKSQALKVQIQGEYSSQLSVIVDQAVKEFFTPFRPDPASSDHGKCENQVCVSLNYNYSKEKQTFEVNWQQSENALTGQVYLTWTKLHPLMDNTVAIGGSPQRPGLPNSNGASIETGLTILNGDLLEIIPTKLKIERRQLSIPQTSHHDNVVCVKEETRYPRTHCSIRMGCDPGDPAPITYCAETQNQWHEITTYSNSQPTLEEIDQPIATQKQIFDGLALKFTWRDIQNGQPREKICPLAVFERVGDGISLRTKIENKPSCNIFEEAAGAVSILSLVNNINFPQDYLAGREVRHFNGTISEQPVKLTYNPYVEFSGTITIRGYNFGSASVNINASKIK